MDHQPPPFFKRGPAPLAQLAFGDAAAQQVAEVKQELLARLAKQGIKV